MMRAAQAKNPVMTWHVTVCKKSWSSRRSDLAVVDVARVETESFIAFVKVSVGDDVDVILVYYMVFKISLYIYIYIFILYIYKY